MSVAEWSGSERTASPADRARYWKGALLGKRRLLRASRIILVSQQIGTGSILEIRPYVGRVIERFNTSVRNVRLICDWIMMETIWHGRDSLVDQPNNKCLSSAPMFTVKQGQYLTFIHANTKMFEQPSPKLI